MLVIPAGSFVMGGGLEERDHRRAGDNLEERPQHTVTIQKRIAVGKFEVTFEDWERCVRGGGCGLYLPSDNNWGRGTRPVINVSMKDALLYVRWLSNFTGMKYRLLSESEWEYCARAGTSSVYYWGDPYNFANQYANVGEDDCCAGARSGSDLWIQTAPVGSLRANNFGLYDMIGNVDEMVADCWHANYENAPTDGSPWMTGDCNINIVRGGSWSSYPGHYRSAYRATLLSGQFSIETGFRIARDIRVRTH